MKREVPKPKRMDVRRECPECGLTGGSMHHWGCSQPLCVVERTFVAIDALPGELRAAVEDAMKDWDK